MPPHPGLTRQVVHHDVIDDMEQRQFRVGFLSE